MKIAIGVQFFLLQYLDQMLATGLIQGPAIPKNLVQDCTILRNFLKLRTMKDFNLYKI